MGAFLNTGENTGCANHERKHLPQLDLSRFKGIRPEWLTPSQLEIVRTRFAETIVTFAVQCADNSELLNALFAACDPDAGLPTPRKLGEGSTRRAWILPFGLVLKHERTDPLSPEEIARLGSAAYLNLRRRTAALGEMSFAIIHPQLSPRIYGFLGAFGTAPRNPAVIIQEALTPLVDLVPPSEDMDIPNERIHVSRPTGELLVDDARFPQLRKPTPEDYALVDLFTGGNADASLGNIGVNAKNRAYLIDSGNYSIRVLHNRTPEYLPVVDSPIVDPWQPVEFGPLHPKHLEQTVTFSRQVMDLYRMILSSGLTYLTSEDWFKIQAA